MGKSTKAKTKKNEKTTKITLHQFGKNSTGAKKFKSTKRIEDLLKKHGSDGIKKDPHSLAIKQSRAAYERAARIAEEHIAKNKGDRLKTFASNGSKTMSGWTGKTTKAPSGFARVEPDKTMKHCEDVGHKLNPHGNDQGIPGRANASHAEKQLSQLTDKPIGVSRKMCPDCKEYFQKDAIHSGKDKIITDPDMTRIFHPDGRITEKPW